MTPTAWRITKRKHAATAFSGRGAMVYPGRWNEPGVRVVYTAATRSLAMLEMLVHLGAEELIEPYVVFPVAVDPADILAPLVKSLPAGWRDEPAGAASQRFGSRWVARGRSPVLRVPSVIVPGEYNYLLNPAHPRFAAVTVGRRQPISFDPRLGVTRT